MVDPLATMVAIARANERLRLALLEAERESRASKRSTNAALVFEKRAKRTRTKAHKAASKETLRRAELALERLAKARVRLAKARVWLDRLLRRVESPLVN